MPNTTGNSQKRLTDKINNKNMPRVKTIDLVE